MAVKYIQEDKLRTCISQLENILASALSDPLPYGGMFWHLQKAIKKITEDLNIMLADKTIGGQSQ